MTMTTIYQCSRCPQRTDSEEAMKYHVGNMHPWSFLVTERFDEQGTDNWFVLKKCSLCLEYVEPTDDNTCMDCKAVYCPKHIRELEDGSCGCTGKCVHDSMHDGLRCRKCFEAREIDIKTSISDWEMRQ